MGDGEIEPEVKQAPGELLASRHALRPAANERDAHRPLLPANWNWNWNASSMFTWQIAVYMLILGLISVLLVPLTNLWWIVLLLGVAAPIALLPGRMRFGMANGDSAEVKARELLEAIAVRGALSPAEAAQWTPCTAPEASILLESLTRQGRLRRHVRDGNAIYALPERTPEHELAIPATQSTSLPDVEPVLPVTLARLADPLSERELEVLAVLATGRTTAEAAGDLFISVGTVKSHTANIYRKLGARNRAEAISRARDLGLLS